MAKTGNLRGRLHPVVAAYVNTAEPLLDILRKADTGTDPVVHALRCLRECMSGQFQREEALALAEKAFPPPRGTDPDLYVLFLYGWATTASYHGLTEASVLLNIAEAMISENRTPPEIRAAVSRKRSDISNTDRIAASRRALSLMPQDSPRLWAVLQDYLAALAAIGRLSEAASDCRRYEELIKERNIPPALSSVDIFYFGNAVETGRVEEALRIEDRISGMLADPVVKRDIHGWVAFRIQALRLMQGRRMQEKTLLPDGDPEPTYALWPAAVTHLLERRPEEALRWARENEKTHPGTALWPPTFYNLALLRSELAAGNAPAARRILETRIAKSGSHYLDDLFHARILLLEGDRSAAARHFAAVRAGCRRYGAEGRLDFELRMACELSPTDMMELSREPVPTKVVAVPAPAAAPAEDRRGVARLVGPSPALAAIRKSIARAAPHDAPVLITGETGTGKELVARAIHEESPRGEEPFIAVNCGSISENLLESELFGHEKGAFTGADRAMPGIFQEAGRGTILLDEIGEITPRLQLAFLRVLESGEIRPVGASKSRKVHCRVIAATNAPLKALVDQGKFRQDLFYRLDRLLIHIPPLRERREDIAPLAVHFLSLGRKEGERATISPALGQALRERPWPGNVRELRNEMERMRLLNSDKLAYDLPDLPGASTPSEARQEPEPVPTDSPAAQLAGDQTAEVKPATDAPPQASQSGGDESILSAGRNPLRMQQRLRELFARHKHLTTAEVRKLLAVSSSTATSYLHRLCAEYCIEKVRPTPSPQSHYFRAKSVVASVAEIQAATRNTTQISTHKPSRTTTPKTSERIVALVRQDPRITRRKLAALIGITEDGVKYHLRALQKAGALKRVGPVNGGHWEATAPAVPLETDNSESDT